MLENGPKKQAQGAPERHRKMLQTSIKHRSFLDQDPSSEASWAPPARKATDESTKKAKRRQNDAK